MTFPARLARVVIGGCSFVLVGLAGVVQGDVVIPTHPTLSQREINDRLSAIEKEIGGRLGVKVVSEDSFRIEYRADERFPMCSTFKAILAACVLSRDGIKSLADMISYGTNDLQEYAPVAKEHVEQGGMSLGDLCAAAVEYSDNTAANLLLRRIGGPAELTNYFRSLGDTVSRLDRTEPTLNTALAGDERDTTSPTAMANDLVELLLRDRLEVDARQQLENWMLNCKTGNKRLRAGLPQDWTVADKTGTGENGTAGDIALVQRPHRYPIVLVVYIHQATVPADEISGAFAKVARLLVSVLAEKS
ncbi:MAG: class A beta-lactamase [Verrucomicrobia bacterium]|nr:class A beta-lactamase [Verrucomicrobiota bacterium]